MTRISSYHGYEIIGLAIQLRSHLDPAIYERLIHGGLDGISTAEAERIIHLLLDLKRSVAQQAKEEEAA